MKTRRRRNPKDNDEEKMNEKKPRRQANELWNFTQDIK